MAKKELFEEIEKKKKEIMDFIGDNNNSLKNRNELKVKVEKNFEEIKKLLNKKIEASEIGTLNESEKEEFIKYYSDQKDLGQKEIRKILKKADNNYQKAMEYLNEEN